MKEVNQALGMAATAKILVTLKCSTCDSSFADIPNPPKNAVRLNRLFLDSLGVDAPPKAHLLPSLRFCSECMCNLNELDLMLSEVEMLRGRIDQRRKLILEKFTNSVLTNRQEGTVRKRQLNKNYLLTTLGDLVISKWLSQTNNSSVGTETKGEEGGVAVTKLNDDADVETEMVVGKPVYASLRCEESKESRRVTGEQFNVNVKVNEMKNEEPHRKIIKFMGLSVGPQAAPRVIHHLGESCSNSGAMEALSSLRPAVIPRTNECIEIFHDQSNIENLGDQVPVENPDVESSFKIHRTSIFPGSEELGGIVQLKIVNEVKGDYSSDVDRLEVPISPLPFPPVEVVLKELPEEV